MLAALPGRHRSRHDIVGQGDMAHRLDRLINRRRNHIGRRFWPRSLMGLEVFDQKIERENDAERHYYPDKDLGAEGNGAQKRIRQVTVVFLRLVVEEILAYLPAFFGLIMAEDRVLEDLGDVVLRVEVVCGRGRLVDRKSTRLNSSHVR